MNEYNEKLFKEVQNALKEYEEMDGDAAIIDACDYFLRETEKLNENRITQLLECIQQKIALAMLELSPTDLNIEVLPASEKRPKSFNP